MSGGSAAVFLDKDGTLIEDLPYNTDPRRIRFAPGARRALPALHAAGFRIVVVTNQSGVARGFSTEADLARVPRRLTEMLEELGVPLAGFYACLHLPMAGGALGTPCGCRKPAPGLIHRAADDLGLDVGASWFVGDTWYDISAGRRAGCRTVQVGPEIRLVHTLPPEKRPTYVAPDLAVAAALILASRPAAAAA
jgi:D-glycero-D-manno-heptose 1,7-bisphosphate phosphatase